MAKMKMKSGVYFCLAVLCLLATAYSEPTLPFEAGETNTYLVKWTGFPAGTTTMSVKEDESQGFKGLRLVLTNESNKMVSMFFPVDDTIVSHIEPKSFRSFAFDKHLKEGDRNVKEEIRFDYEEGQISWYEHVIKSGSKRPPWKREKMKHGGYADPLSIVYITRLIEFDDEGRSRPIPLFADGKMFELVFKLVGETEIKSSHHGTRTCLHIKPEAKFGGVFLTKGELDLFIDKETKIPIRFRFSIPVGWASIELTDSTHPSLEKIKDEQRGSRRKGR